MDTRKSRVHGKEGVEDQDMFDMEPQLLPLDSWVSETIDRDTLLKDKKEKIERIRKKVPMLQPSLFVGFESLDKTKVESHFLSICTVYDDGSLRIHPRLETGIDLNGIEDPYVQPDVFLVRNQIEGLLLPNELLSPSNQTPFETHMHHDPSTDLMDEDDHVNEPFESNMDLESDMAQNDDETPQVNDNSTLPSIPTIHHLLGQTLIDPWEELDPHDLSSKPARPFKKGNVIRTVKPLNFDENDAFLLKPDEVLSMKMNTTDLMRPFLSEFHGAYDLETKKMDKRRVKKMKQEIQSLEAHQGLIPSHPIDDKDSLSEEEENTPWVEGDEEDTTLENEPFLDQNIQLEYHHEDIDFEENKYTYEELCRYHIEKHIIESQQYIQESDLTKRVTQWNQRIEPILLEQENRKPFDIKEYGTEFIDTFPDKDKSKEYKLETIMANKEPFEICRYFTAMLQLINNGNVEILAHREEDQEVHDISLKLVDERIKEVFES